MLSRVFMQRSQSDGFGLSRSDGPFGETTLADQEATICSHHTVAHGKPLLSPNVFQHPRGITKSATEPFARIVAIFHHRLIYLIPLPFYESSTA
jgi:hypothetical protein